ncbi:acetylajmalan esterase-like protein [Cinnamomum micranthum f. kanehirae]|uniref:Acetylajmalan esterase-like protein n=1 Tax=Cinnamomum micranthum f. kanehirae TaxID=337451 RepID=A0A443P872_9MAGN|nr:acetylajmalan esterase-like protein [Cinnamomum micranthum f. kanehirae]
MASVAFFVLMALQVWFSVGPCSAQFKDCNFEAIYSFGDSIADTGNLVHEGLLGSFSAIANLPYGETYFNKSTGRCSDGQLIVDFLARSLDLPLLNPYLQKDAEFSHGVNFAVAGATALKASFFQEKNIQMMYTTSSLNVQLNWFKTHLSSICSSRAECAKKLEKALFLAGEIGGNDYNYAFFQGRSIEEVKSYVPNVVQAVKDAARELIDTGANQLIVPGNFPVGCMPSYLTLFRSNNPAAYDENKCLKDFNNFSKHHNEHLQGAIEELRQEFPHARILYADYYNMLMEIIVNSTSLGFEGGSSMKACCGTGGDYNFDMTKMCGGPGVPACPRPELYIHWDGIHLTQQAYRKIADAIIAYGHREWICKSKSI